MPDWGGYNYCGPRIGYDRLSIRRRARRNRKNRKRLERQRLTEILADRKDK